MEKLKQDIDGSNHARQLAIPPPQRNRRVAFRRKTPQHGPIHASASLRGTRFQNFSKLPLASGDDFG
jgi:hypothetical protein